MTGLWWDASFGPNLRQKRSRQQNPSQGNSANYYIILDLRDKAAPPTSQQIGQFLSKRVKYPHRHPFLFLFLPHPQQSSLLSTNQRQSSTNNPNYVREINVHSIKNGLKAASLIIDNTIKQGNSVSKAALMIIYDPTKQGVALCNT